jgi:hypothetical protein
MSTAIVEATGANISVVAFDTLLPEQALGTAACAAIRILLDSALVPRHGVVDPFQLHTFRYGRIAGGQAMASMPNVVHRYTILASALDVLRNKRLVLVNPHKWPDQNDTAFIEQYRVARNFRSICALCLTEAAETSHHWTAFASGTDGVRIELYRDRLEEAVGACLRIPL